MYVCMYVCMSVIESTNHFKGGVKVQLGVRSSVHVKAMSATPVADNVFGRNALHLFMVIIVIEVYSEDNCGDGSGRCVKGSSN